MRRKFLPILLAFLLTGCGAATESVPTSTQPVTEPAETESLTETSTVTEPVTTAATEPLTETEPQTESETTTEPETPPADQPPQLLNWDPRWGYWVTVGMGDHRDLDEIISYGDDHDPHPSMTWEGDFDPDEPGEYPITVTLTDSEGNSADYDLTVSVPWETMTAGSDFDLFLSQNEGKPCGIDVSVWQGDVDYDAVKNAGAEFVLMRIGYGDSYGSELDEKFTQNLENARAAGLRVGVYYYSTADSPEGAAAQADWILNQLDGAALDFPVAYDWENFSCFQEWGMSFDTLNAVYDTFSERMAENGYDTMLYAEPNTLGKAWYLPGKTVWLADYGVNTGYEGDHYMRQCWNTGRIDGIDGDVDLNVLMK